MARNPRMPDLGIGLSPEMKDVFDGVQREMDAWIDEKVEGLREEVGQALTQAERDMNARIGEVEEDLARAREEMDALLTSVNELAADFEAGDGETLQEAVAKTKDLVGKVRAEIEAHERRWKKLGKTGTRAAIKAVGSAFGVPL